MGAINQETSAEELAAVVSQALEQAGIRATLSGGGAVSLYTENEYESYDLDFITSARNDAIEKAIGPLGFHRVGGLLRRVPAGLRKVTLIAPVSHCKSLRGSVPCGLL